MLNLTNLSNANNPYEQLTILNLLADYWIGNLLLLTIFICLLVAFYKYEKELPDVLLFSSGITIITSILFLALELIPKEIFKYPAILLVVSIIIKMMDR